ncbi:MAG: serine hydrolase, partial [Chloroflexota bacterium]
MSRLFGFFSLITMLCLGVFHAPVHAQNVDYLATYPDCEFDNPEVDAGLAIGAVVLDFNTRLGCVQNLDMTFNTASVPKIFVAAAYYDAVVTGTFNSTSTLQFTRDYWMGGNNDCLSENDIGTNYTYTELVEFMINCSDNAATWMLMDALGWQRVNDYVQSLGIAGIGEVIPYAEVDRLKLEFWDERWADVPTAMASRFYRSGRTAGLDAYFDTIPDRPGRATFINMNQRYFDDYSFNTLTPRALASFIDLLRTYKQSGTPEQWFVATSVFNVMLFTQRQYST